MQKGSSQEIAKGRDLHLYGGQISIWFWRSTPTLRYLIDDWGIRYRNLIGHPQRNSSSFTTRTKVGRDSTSLRCVWPYRWYKAREGNYTLFIVCDTYEQWFFQDRYRHAFYTWEVGKLVANDSEQVHRTNPISFCWVSLPTIPVIVMCYPLQTYGTSAGIFSWAGITYLVFRTVVVH